MAAQARPLLGARRELPAAAALQLEVPSFYWSSPAAGLRVAGFGEAARREAPAGGLRPLVAALTTGPQVRWLSESSDVPLPPGPWLGAAAFASAMSGAPSWEGFAPARFIAPALLSWSEGGRHFAAALAEADDGEGRGSAGDGTSRGDDEGARRILVARLDALAARLSAPGARHPLPPLPALTVPAQRPSARGAWTQLVGDALDSIARGELSKVVVARALDARAASPIDPRPVLAALEARHPSCRTFLVQGDSGAFFLGATPELLLRIDDGRLDTEAVAGSAAPGEAALLPQRRKDQREHRWVVDHLAGALQRLSSQVALPESPSVRVLSNVAHLVTQISARLSPGVGPAEVLAALHPTPAVAGVPAAAALRFLAEHEALDRGLYAGPVGLLGEGRAELWVALRSALVRSASVRLFAGAGVVEGSCADDEWRETELKLNALLPALGGGFEGARGGDPDGAGGVVEQVAPRAGGVR